MDEMGGKLPVCCCCWCTERACKARESDIRSRIWSGQRIVHLYAEHYRSGDCWVFRICLASSGRVYHTLSAFLLLCQSRRPAAVVSISYALLSSLLNMYC